MEPEHYRVEMVNGYYALYRRSWTSGVPRMEKWEYVDMFFTEAQVRAHIAAHPAATITWML